MRCLICCGWPWPLTLTSSAASPATCGDAWLVPTNPVNRLPATQDVSTGVPVAVKLAIRVFEQNDHTHDAMSLPHGHVETVLFTKSMLPPGAATVIAERPKSV